MALLMSDNINRINIINPINVLVNCIYLYAAYFNKILCYKTCNMIIAIISKIKLIE